MRLYLISSVYPGPVNTLTLVCAIRCSQAINRVRTYVKRSGRTTCHGPVRYHACDTCTPPALCLYCTCACDIRGQSRWLYMYHELIAGLSICLIWGRYQCKIVSFFPIWTLSFPIWLLEKKIGKVEKKNAMQHFKNVKDRILDFQQHSVCKIHDVQLKERSIWITNYVLFFPNFKENTAIFPNSKGPGPQSQNGVWEPWIGTSHLVVWNEGWHV